MSLLKQKKRTDKTNTKNQKFKQRKSIQNIENKKQYHLNVLNKNNVFNGNSFTICRSCFWFYPINGYNRYNANGFYTACPLCTSDNIKNISISSEALFNYILKNIN